MTTLDELSTTEATLPMLESAMLMEEIFNQSSWRLYVSTEYPETEILIRRFLNAHSKIPGLFSDELSGIIPMDTFRIKNDDNIIEGFLFLNGAVMKLHNNDKEIFSLFIDEETSVMWGYPNSFLSYADRHQAIGNEQS